MVHAGRARDRAAAEAVRPDGFCDRDALRELPIDNEAFEALSITAAKVPVDAKPHLHDQDDQIPAGLFACGMVYNLEGRQRQCLLAELVS